MSCDNSNVYAQTCCPDTPYPTVQHESVPSLIDNLVFALYGEITKTVQGGRVVWDIPCDPSSNPTEVPSIPRNTGEGLLCYLMRVFQNTVGQYSPFQYWSYSGDGSTVSFSLSPSVNTLRSSYLVYLNGIVQAPTSYTISNTTPVNLVFPVAPSGGTSITIINLGYQPPGVIQDVTQSDATPTGSSQTLTVGAWLAYLIAQIATKLTAPAVPALGTWQLAATSGTVSWQQITQLPAVPSAPGQVALASPGSGIAPSWTSLPSLAIGPIVSTGSNWTNNFGTAVTVGGVSYPVGATISTPQYIEDRFATTVKVADFGAVGDGVTDDVWAIQAAINYAISKGNAVIEFEAKTYRITASKANTQGTVWPLLWNWNHLEINGGTADLKLRFKGNGAKLFTDAYVYTNSPANRIAIFFAITTEAKELIWEDMTFERGSGVRVSNDFGSGSAFFASRPVANYSITDRVAFRGCKFVNGFMGVWDNRGFSVSKTWRTLRNLETINCDFIFPYGCGSNNPAGGGQTINLSGWVDQHICIGCTFDAAVNAVIPNNITYPTDGFNYVNAYSTWISNCTFKHNWVETLLFETPPNWLYRINSFTQPAVGSSVTVTINAGDNWNEEIIAGKTYFITDTSGAFNYAGVPYEIGVYRADTGASSYSVGGQITFTRLPDDTVLLPSGALPNIGQFPAAGTIFGNCRISMAINGDGVGGAPSASITNCKFLGKPVKRQDGTSQLAEFEVINQGSGYTSPPTVTVNPSNGVVATAVINGSGNVTGITISPSNTRFWYTSPPTVTITGGGGSSATARARMLSMRPSPAIGAKIRTTVSNNHFEGCNTAYVDDPIYEPGGQGPIIFTGNIVLAEKDPIVVATGQFKGTQVQSTTPCSVVSNNVFIADSKDAFGLMLQVGREGQMVLNNTFWCNNPAPAGSGAIAIALFNTSNYAEWDMVLDNIVAYGFNYALYSNVPVTYGSIRGKSTTALAAVYQDSGSSKFFKSPNGTNWRLRVTNDGEIMLSPYTPI